MARWNRRNFMKGSLATAASAHFLQASPGAAQQASLAASAESIVDTHVYLSRWPGRRVPGDQPEELVSGLRKQTVVQACAGSFDALLHKDIGAVNERLAADCTKYGQGLLLPFGAVNPMLPDWEEDIRRCHETYRMPGIRIHPSYHSYTLENRVVPRLLRMCTERNLIVQIVAWMEDERTQLPALQIEIVDLRPLAALLEAVPKARVMVLNGFVSPQSRQLPWGPLKRFDNLVFDFAMLEQLMGLKALIDAIGVERVVFGSYSPMFYFESAFLKVREADLSASQTEAVFGGNAARWLPNSRA
jgi:hypothetical protein